ncbi:hypothetical protein ANN_00487 [Periplaneta americana]|uniref:Uncharacterized protein n=1 Tax=Periplaneta americana TaxID=6978 RepID=A0ABQ8TSQ7_PERAM|nr:hypothetical protein ANN_00487 [Periplaneta americana]
MENLRVYDMPKEKKPRHVQLQRFVEEFGSQHFPTDGEKLPYMHATAWILKLLGIESVNWPPRSPDLTSVEFCLPKSPPNSPNTELSTDDDLKGVYINYCYKRLSEMKVMSAIESSYQAFALNELKESPGKTSTRSLYRRPPEAADSLVRSPWNVVKRRWMASAMAPGADLLGGGISPRTDRGALGEFSEAGMLLIRERFIFSYSRRLTNAGLPDNWIGMTQTTADTSQGNHKTLDKHPVLLTEDKLLLLATRESNLGVTVKYLLKGQRFASAEEVKIHSTCSVQEVTKDWLQEYFEKWCGRWQKCVTAKGANFKGGVV